MKKIAIVGATGYIGKSLLFLFAKYKKYDIFPFVRSKEKLGAFLESIGDMEVRGYTFEQFNSYEYDIVINCVGIGNPSILKKNPREIFRITREFDDLILSYMRKHSETLYVNLSSGAVHTVDKQKAMSVDPSSDVALSVIPIKEYYAIAKVQSEARHRTLPELAIVDLRVFNFFSRFYDKDADFLMSEIAECLKKQKVFKTTSGDMVRDFINMHDLYALIEKVIERGRANDALDVYSAAPVTKHELIKSLHDKYKLEYVIDDGEQKISPTGVKNEYIPHIKIAESIGYVPKFTSIGGIEHEIDAMFGM